MSDDQTSPVPFTASAALDDPVGGSLASTHAHLARRVGAAVTFRSDVASFVAVDGVGPGADVGPDSPQWEDVARLLGRGGLADMFSSPATPPSTWEPVFSIDGLQFVGPESADAIDETASGIVELGPDDLDDMLALVTRTRPGPFFPRTPDLGTYLGVRRDGHLVAMAGERLRPPGWTEISAVCTAPEVRGQGHAARLITALVARIIARGEHPFLHSAAANTRAVAVYEQLGFRVRRSVTFRGFRVP